MALWKKLKKKSNSIRTKSIDLWKKLKIRRCCFQPQRSYDHIISLGYNCEISFQFFHLYRFLESNLFAWTYSYSLQDTIYALQHLDKVGTNGFLLANSFFQCVNTKICFHGKDDPHMSLEELKAELTGRIEYLKNKWLRICSTKDQSILFIVKVRIQPIEQNVEEIKQLYQTLKQMTAAPFDLLVVCGKLATLPDFKHPHIFVRQVKHFAPDDDVPSKRLAAMKDWEHIFFEFGPKHYLEHITHFKFEKP